MEYALLLGLFLEANIAYIISGRDILSPWFVSCGMFGLAVTVATINLRRWGIIIEPLTVLLILCALFFMGLGEVIGRKMALYVKPADGTEPAKFNLILIPKWSSFLWFCAGILICYYTYLDIVSKAQSVGFSGSGYLLNYARMAMLNSEITNNKVLALGQYAVIGVGYVFIFSWINNFIFFPGQFVRKNKHYLLPFLPWLGVVILSTGRNEFIRFFQMVIFLFLIGWRMKRGGKRISFFRTLLIGVSVIVVFFFLFQVAGILTGKTYMYGTWDMFSIYSGSSIAALNEGLKTVIVGEKGFGVYTFTGLRSLLARFGFPLFLTEKHYPFVIFDNGISTNIYTALMPYFSDFGFTGTLLIYLLMGIFFAFFYYALKRLNNFGLIALSYVFFAYALISQVYAADFLRSYISVTHSFVLFFLMAGYWIFVSGCKKSLVGKSGESYLV